jgi:pimeloyl-ACP methyl ester carboxylesterase
MNRRDIENFRAAEERLWAHYGAAPVEHFVPLPAINSRVRVLEVGQGAPLLFVHGSPNAGSKWAPLAARLTGFRCLILDRPGCGLSEPVDYRRLDLRTFGADLLCQTLDAFELPRAGVVASSLGGALAFYFARAHPERVTHLVQAGCPAFVHGFRLPFYNLLSSVLGQLVPAYPAPFDSAPSESAFRHMGHTAAINQGRFAKEVLVWRDALLKYTDTGRHENALNRHLARRLGSYRYGPDFVRALTLPTLYLWGESDPFGGVELGRQLAAAQPNAVLHAFPDSGHLPWLDDAEGHAALLRDFLQS